MENQQDSLNDVLNQSAHDDVVQSLSDRGFFRRLGDEIPKRLASGARLLNYPYATIVEFRSGTALYIPVAVSDSPSGRRTVYELRVGEKTLMGIFVQNNRLYEEYFTRRDNDRYDVVVTTLNSDDVVFSGEGTLERIDERVGVGRMSVTGTSTDSSGATAKETKTEVWVLWSCIRIRHESKEKLPRLGGRVRPTYSTSGWLADGCAPRDRLRSARVLSARY